MADYIDSKEPVALDQNQPEATPESAHRTKSLTNPTIRRPFLGKVLGVLKKIGKEVIVRDEKIPLEQINEQSVANAISQRLGNPLQEKVNGDRYANPFDIVSVITELGYIAPSSFADYMKKFPKEYQATRVALWNLHQQGVLDINDQEQSSPHGEIRYYKVVDSDLLNQIAQGEEKPQAK